MFETIVSQVKTGRVQKQLFETREEAEKFLTETEERIINPSPVWSKSRMDWVTPKPKSMRDFRLEIVYRDAPVVMQVAGRVQKRRKKVAA